MATTQYIGARYVPIFADKAWSSETAYEPLTIVLHNGNSYTSRQYVPTGVDIENADYWAETGNYNAQVEAYRKEVLKYELEITNAQKTADNALSASTENHKSIDTINTILSAKADFAKKSVELSEYMYSGNDLITAINLALAENENNIDTLIFPGGNFNISQGFDLQTYVKHAIGNGTTITADSTMYSMVNIGAGCTFENINLNGNGKAERCIGVGQQARIINCTLKDATKNYLSGGSQGVEIHNCRIYNTITNAKPESTGVLLGTDTMISDSWFWGHRTALNIGSNSIVNHCYFWNYYATFNCVGIYSGSAHIMANDVFFDCINEPFNGNYAATGVNVYLNSRDTASNTNPYYKLSKTFYNYCSVQNFYASTDGTATYTEPTSYNAGINIVSCSEKTDTNYQDVDFSLVGIDNYMKGKNIVAATTDTTNFYKVAEIAHTTGGYQVLITMYNPVRRGCILTITNNEIFNNTSLFHYPYFNTSDSIRFNEENNVLSIYAKYSENSPIGFNVIYSAGGIKRFSVLNTPVQSTITNYNRTFSS